MSLAFHSLQSRWLRLIDASNCDCNYIGFLAGQTRITLAQIIHQRGLTMYIKSVPSAFTARVHYHELYIDHIKAVAFLDLK